MLPTKKLKRSRSTVVEVYLSIELKSINLYLEGAAFSASTIC